MRLRPRFLALGFFVSFVVPASASSSIAAGESGNIDPGPVIEDVSEYRLTNGLKVVLFPDGSRPVVTVNVVYGVGAAQENYGETGMAHLLEHLLFKGTPTHPDIPDDFKKRGIDFNGNTWLDRTTYFGSFTSNPETLDWLLALEADRMVNSRIARDDLDSEMTVVRNEMESGENNPVAVFQQKLRAAAFQWHSYGKSTIGNRADVENVPIERLQAFYRTWYQPDNATLVVAGDFETGQVLASIQHNFGGIPRPARVLPPRYTVEPTQDGEREINIRRVGDLNLFGLAYRAPAATHPDSAPLRVLVEIMGRTPGGRLHEALVKDGLAVGSSAGLDTFQEPGLVTFLVVPGQGVASDTVERTLLKEVEDLADRPFTDADVAAARQRLADAHERALNDVNTMAIALSESIANGDWRLWFVGRDALDKVTAADVNRVARTYLLRSNRTLARFIPTPEPVRAEITSARDAASLVEGYQGRSAVTGGEAFDPTPANIEARAETLRIGDKLKVALLPRKTRGGMVTAVLVFRFGDEASIRGLTDAAGIAGSMLLRGSKSLTREQIYDRFSALKTEANVGGGPQNAVITLTARRENFVEALRLATDVLRHPSFPEPEFERLRDEWITGMEAGRQEPTRVADEALQRHFNRWPEDHPYAFRALDEQIAAIRAVRLEDVRAFHQDFYGTAVGEIAIVGDFDADQMKDELRRSFSGWSSPKPYQYIASPHGLTAATRQSVETPDKAGAALLARLAFSLKTTDPQYPALVVANHVLGGGVSSRLGNRIRQREGLSYGIGSRLWGGDLDDGGGLQIGATTAPQNVAQLERALREELHRFVQTGITGQELADAKGGLLASYAGSRTTDSAIARLLQTNLYLGRTMHWTEAFESGIRELTVEEVNAAIKRHLRPEILSIFVAGDFPSEKK